MSVSFRTVSSHPRGLDACARRLHPRVVVGLSVMAAGARSSCPPARVIPFLCFSRRSRDRGGDDSASGCRQSVCRAGSGRNRPRTAASRWRSLQLSRNRVGPYVGRKMILRTGVTVARRLPNRRVAQSPPMRRQLQSPSYLVRQPSLPRWRSSLVLRAQKAPPVPARRVFEARLRCSTDPASLSVRPQYSPMSCRGFNPAA